MQQCSGVIRLAQICTNSMVRDVSMLLRFMVNNCLPDEVIVELMRSALEHQRDRAIDVLICYWPFKVLDMKTLLPPVSVTLTTLQSICRLETDRQRMLKTTEYLVHAFVKGIKAGNLHKLRFLNSASYPIREETSNLLCKFCLTWKPPGFARYHNQYMVKFDNVANTNNPMQSAHSLMQALKRSNSTKPRPFRIFIEHMNLRAHPSYWIIRLMKCIDKKVLLKLTISLIPLMNEGLTSLVPMLGSYTSLTMLDISNNCLNLSSANHATESLKVVLQRLENLVNLNLSSNRIRGLISILLPCVSGRLQGLKLSGCWLSEADILSLASSSHMSSIQELDISYNSAVGQVGIQTMLNNAVSLKFLNLSGCKLKHNWLVSGIIDKLKNMPELDLSDNEIGNDVVYYSLIKAFIENRTFGQLYLDIPESEDVFEDADVQMKMNKIQRLVTQADWNYSISEWLVIHKSLLL